MNRMDALTARRRQTRHEHATAAVSLIQSRASDLGIDMTLVGSLARGDFRFHSDVDLLVRGSVDAGQRLLAERLVAEGMRESGIPYDLIFEQDLTEERLREILNGAV